MSVVAHQSRALVAVAHRCLLSTRRYPASMVNMLFLVPVYQLVLPAVLLGTAFMVGGRAAGLSSTTGTDDVLGWLLAGMIVGSLTVSVMWQASFTMAADRNQGALEAAWSAPVTRDSFVAGAALSGAALGIVSGGVLLVCGAVIGVRLHVTVVLVLPVLALLMPGLVGLGFLGAALILRFRKAQELVQSVGYVLLVLSGTAFPVALLPQGMRELSYLLPMTWATDLVRVFALDTRPVVPWPAEVGLLAATSVLVLAVGRFALLRVDRWLVSTGGVAHH